MNTHIEYEVVWSGATHRQFQTLPAPKPVSANAERSEEGLARVRSFLTEDWATNRSMATRAGIADRSMWRWMQMLVEAGDAERRRLEREGFGPGWSGPPPGDWSGEPAPSALPPAIRWLRALPPGWPVPVGLALLALPVGLYVAWPAAGLVAGALLLVLCTPPGWRSRRRWRSW